MTTQEKATIHDHINAYRLRPALDLLALHLRPRPKAEREKLAQLDARYDHYFGHRSHDYGPHERRRESDEIAKQLQLILARLPVNDKALSLPEILGRDLDEDFKEREADRQAEPAQHKQDDRGIFGEVEYRGSPTLARDEAVLSKSYGATYHQIIQTLRQKNIEIGKGDRDGGRIHASAKGSHFNPAGEQIHFWVSPLPQGRTRVTIVVDSQNTDLRADFGRHAKLLAELMHKVQFG